MLTIFLALGAATAAAPAPSTGAPDALPAWSIVGVAAAEGAGSPIHLRVRGGDLDGDGRDDEAAVRLDCRGGTLAGATYRIISPRDVASGQASGKRQHKPTGFIKEWDAATPQLSAMKPSYDLKAAKGARVAAGAEGWTVIALGATDGLCAAAAAAAATATKSRSNIQNN